MNIYDIIRCIFIRILSFSKCWLNIKVFKFNEKFCIRKLKFTYVEDLYFLLNILRIIVGFGQNNLTRFYIYFLGELKKND